MGKSKRNCRRTEDEVRIHEKAVKMRKMTDEQLVHYVEDRVEKPEAKDLIAGRRNLEAVRAQGNSLKNCRRPRLRELEQLQSINY